MKSELVRRAIERTTETFAARVEAMGDEKFNEHIKAAPAAYAQMYIEELEGCIEELEKELRSLKGAD